MPHFCLLVLAAAAAGRRYVGPLLQVVLLLMSLQVSAHFSIKNPTFSLLSFPIMRTAEGLKL